MCIYRYEYHINHYVFWHLHHLRAWSQHTNINIIINIIFCVFD